MLLSLLGRLQGHTRGQGTQNSMQKRSSLRVGCLQGLPFDHTGCLVLTGVLLLCSKPYRYLSQTATLSRTNRPKGCECQDLQSDYSPTPSASPVHSRTPVES